MLECCLQINLAAKITWIESLTCSSIIILALIHQQLRESKIQAVIHIYATTEGPRGKSAELFQAVVQHNVRLNGKLLGEEPRNMVQQLLERPK